MTAIAHFFDLFLSALALAMAYVAIRIIKQLHQNFNQHNHEKQNHFKDHHHNGY